MTNEDFMYQALMQTNIAFKRGEIPIGAVIVKDGHIIAKAYNKRNTSKKPTHHAEILAIEKAAKKIGDWRLEDCDIYISTIPCPMCAGAIVNARINNVYYGASNENKEIFEMIMTQSSLNHHCNYFGGILEQECANILKEFFKSKR